MEKRNAGNSDQITRDYFDSLLLEMRHLDGKKPDTTLELYGERFQTPIMTAALSHLDKVRDKGMVEMARGAFLAGAVNWAGMGDKQELEAIVATGARTIKIIKPYADHDMILDRIAHAEKCGALAVGMDIDHAFDAKGNFDRILGYDMSPKTQKDICSFVKATSLPFIVKGVLSRQDAYKCLMAGVKGIVVSHHHGIMDYAVPPLRILPEIVKVVQGQIPVFVDCGIISGMDAYKALALGAAAVCAGRVVMGPLGENGAEGVRDQILGMNEELKGVMARTGCGDLGSMDSSVIVPTQISV
ncbi:MAG: alpha-hydroxy-acid oxidizing protein [Lachnospiraceae bacterium]|nr:alpha-hydroxy-acid oxidizing protein [Lachnospiraceae bacterium]